MIAIVVILVLLLINGFFVAAEFAIVGAPRAAIDARAARKDRLAGLVRAGDADLLARHLHLDAGVEREVHLPLRTLDLDVAVRDGDLDLVRDLDRELADSGHGFSYQTVQMISPPTFCLRASRSTSTPFDVERMAIPIPFSTLGMESVGT